MMSIPNLNPFWYYSLDKPLFRVRSGEVALNCPGLRSRFRAWGLGFGAEYGLRLLTSGLGLFMVQGL